MAPHLTGYIKLLPEQTSRLPKRETVESREPGPTESKSSKRSKTPRRCLFLTVLTKSTSQPTPDNMARTQEVIIYGPAAFNPQPPTYSHISSVPISATTRLVSFAGQTGAQRDANGTVSHPAKLADQVRQALQNVDTCMKEAGVSKKHMVSNRQYVVHMMDLSDEEFKERGDIFMEWWRSTEGERPPPPDTLIGVDSLAGKSVKYECECTFIAQL